MDTNRTPAPYTPTRSEIATAYAIRVLSHVPATLDVTTAIAGLERTLPPAGSRESRAIWDATPMPESQREWLAGREAS